jgi:transposase
MTNDAKTKTVATIGIDLGKTTFQICGMNACGVVVLRQKVSRRKLGQQLANLPPCLIGMEACAGAHHVGRHLATLGHDVRLIPAQYVKPFLKGHKNDYRDAEAIAEAVQRPTMRFVPLKSVDQLDLQAMHRVRSRLVGQRTAVINQIRGFLLEHGITVRQGPAGLRQALPAILAQRSDVLAPRIVHLVEDLVEDWHRLDARVGDVTGEIVQLARQDENCKRLQGVPGVGPLTASAVVAAIGNGAAFAKGRDFSSWLGLVPKQISTGGRTILGSISRRICALCSSKAPDPSCSRRRIYQSTSSVGGWRRQRHGCIATCLRSRWQTNSPASPGASSTADVVTRSTTRITLREIRLTYESQRPRLPAEVCEVE